jgi:hypothetical protein
VPALVDAAGERAGIRFLEFFASAIRNPHTRRAYARATADFLAWCAGAGVTSITAVQPLHVASWIERFCRKQGLDSFLGPPRPARRFRSRRRWCPSEAYRRARQSFPQGRG